MRCFTCNNPISSKYLAYLKEKEIIDKKQKKNNKEQVITTNQINKGNIKITEYGKLLNNLGIHLYCCRRMFLGQVDIVDII